jgi:hypothetical protein
MLDEESRKRPSGERFGFVVFENTFNVTVELVN